MSLTPNRRDVLKWGLAAGAAAGVGLPARAQGAAIPYGAALYRLDLDADPTLGVEIAKRCQRVTPVSELKWNASRPAPGAFLFGPGDGVADFARDNGLDMHGHTLIWYADNPDWVLGMTSAAEAEHEMADHISTLMLRYRDVAPSWDVVNEPIPDVADTPKARRDCIWSSLLGNDYIATAFRMAHEIDPDALLMLNEYDIEFATQHSPAKRAAFIDLIHELMDKDVPLHGIGVQAHLRGGWPIAKDEVAAFADDMRNMGLKVLVTELDVMDHELPGPIAERDAVIAAQVKDLLDALGDTGPVHSVTTWGLTDKFTWIKWAYPRADGAGNRPLPLDENYQPKPMHDVISRFRGIA